MSRPLCSVVVPTIGRQSLARTLESIRQQVGRQEAEIVVVADTHAGTHLAALLPVPALCAAYHARYVPHDGGLHAWGQPQRNHGQAVARGAWLAFSQDDGAWLPGAWAAIHGSIGDPVGERCPRLFQVSPRPGLVVWDSRQLDAGHVDADCLVVPNRPARLGMWTPEYTGDAAMIAETVGLWQGQVRFEPALIARGWQ